MDFVNNQVVLVWKIEKNNYIFGAFLGPRQPSQSISRKKDRENNRGPDRKNVCSIYGRLFVRRNSNLESNPQLHNCTIVLPNSLPFNISLHITKSAAEDSPMLAEVKIYTQR